MEVDSLHLRAVMPQGACQPRGIRGRYTLGEESIAALDLGPVGAGSASQRDIQQEQIVDVAVQQALLKKPQLVVQVRQGPAQQGVQPARSPGGRPMKRCIRRQMMEIALQSPDVHLRLAGRPVQSAELIWPPLGDPDVVNSKGGPVEDSGPLFPVPSEDVRKKRLAGQEQPVRQYFFVGVYFFQSALACARNTTGAF